MKTGVYGLMKTESLLTHLAYANKISDVKMMQDVCDLFHDAAEYIAQKDPGEMQSREAIEHVVEVLRRLSK